MQQKFISEDFLLRRGVPTVAFGGRAMCEETPQLQGVRTKLTDDSTRGWLPNQTGDTTFYV